MWLSHHACLRSRLIQSKAQIGQDRKGYETRTPCAGTGTHSPFVAKVFSGRFTCKSKIGRSGAKESKTSGSSTRQLSSLIVLKQLTACSLTTTTIAVNEKNRSTSQPSPLYVLLELCSISCARLPGALAAESISDAEAEGVMYVTAGGGLSASATDLCELPTFNGGNPPDHFERRRVENSHADSGASK